MLRTILTVALTLGLTFPAAVRADALADAWQAHEDLQFDLALAAAQGAIESGELSRHQLADAYMLIGRCEASMRHEREAVDAFVRALALDEDSRLSEHASPVERGPFMEAGGFWLDHDRALDVDATTTEDGWDVTTIDPAGIAAALRVYDAKDRLLGELKPVDRVTLQIPSSQPVDSVVLVDGHGNALVQLVVPERANEVPGAEAPPRPPQSPVDATKRTRLRRAAFTQVSIGAAVALLGIPAHVARERAVNEWNGPGCTELNAADHAAQCAHLPERISVAQRAAIALYATGGVLVASGMVTWAFARRRSGRERRVACLPAGAGALCTGHF